MKKLIPFLLLCSGLLANAQSTNRISLTIVVTNAAVTGDEITILAVNRIWTNAHSASTILTNLVSKNHSATNLFNNFANHPLGSGIQFDAWLTTNSFRIRAPFGGALSASSVGTWATLTLSTQSGPSTLTALWPIENLAGPAVNKTNQASSLVYGLSTYSTNAFATNSSAGSNFLTKGASPLQVAISPFQFNGAVGLSIGQATNLNLVNSTNDGFVGKFRNGVYTNAILDRPTSTNLVNRGEAISSPGTNGVGSEQFGTGARATNEAALAVGNAALALGPFSTATGNDSSASGYGDSAFGYGAVVNAGNGVAAGAGAVVTGTNGAAFGTLATVTHADSSAFGTGAESTETNQNVIGTATQTVSIPGLIIGPTQTNSTLTGTNVIRGRVDFTSRANSSLANGNNAAIVLGTNTYVRLSGPSAAYVINGIAAEQDGSWHIIEAENPVNSLTIAHQSGTDPAAANRIVTGTGADVVLTNNPAIFEAIYNASAARWRLKGVWR
jgi:hypothetical protein